MLADGSRDPAKTVLIKKAKKVIKEMSCSSPLQVPKKNKLGSRSLGSGLQVAAEAEFCFSKKKIVEQSFLILNQSKIRNLVQSLRRYAHFNDDTCNETNFRIDKLRKIISQS